MGCKMCTRGDSAYSIEQDWSGKPHIIDSTLEGISESDNGEQRFHISKGVVLGLGGFGLVRTAVKINNVGKEESYAVKSMSKFELLKPKTGLLAAYHELKNLIFIGQRIDSSTRIFFCHIQYAMQDDKFLYVFLDLCHGGDMRLNLNNSRGRKYDEDTCKFYISQVILALHSCHEASILHRDCKPENIMLCSNGYLKLTDFGVAKILDNIDVCLSTSGTHGYLAPEVYVAPHQQGRAVDWFAMGVTLHEFITGRRPFDAHRLAAFKDPLHTDNLDTPFLRSREVSMYSKSFVAKALDRFQVSRMGSKSGIEEIKRDPWFRNFDWDAILTQKIIAPFLPPSNIYNPEMECENTIRSVKTHLQSPGISIKDQAQFNKFYYSIDNYGNGRDPVLEFATQFSDDMVGE